MNDSNRHNYKYRKVWRDIKSLVGTEVVVESAKDGIITWRAVKAIEDELVEERQRGKEEVRFAIGEEDEECDKNFGM